MIVEINLAEQPSAQPLTWEDTELGPREAIEYRAAAARLNYLALDRPEILFVSKECSRRMSAPRNGDWTALKRVVRYVLCKPRALVATASEALGIVAMTEDFGDTTEAYLLRRRERGNRGC